MKRLRVPEKDKNEKLVQEDTKMTDCVGNKDNAFVYTYSAQKSKEIVKIRNKYLSKEESKLEKLIQLDKQTEKKGQAVSIALGVIGSLLLGVGMCCTMVWNVGIVTMIIGIIIGVCNCEESCTESTAEPMAANIAE